MQTRSAAIRALSGRNSSDLSTEIRPMLPADLHAVLAIQAACYTQIEPESKRSFDAKLAAAPASCFIASSGQQAIGYLVALPWDFSNPPTLNQGSCVLPTAPDCLYLHDLAVAPAARATGAGRALVGAFFAHLQALQLPRASLIAIQDSAPYWRRHGFEAVIIEESLQARLASYGEDVQYMEYVVETDGAE